MSLPVFFSAPHRVMFLSGTVQALLLMAFWSLEVGARYAGLWPAVPWPLLDRVPSPVLHALLVSCGVFPFFMFGFIFTAGPRWQGAGELLPKQYLPAFLLLASGWGLVWLSLLVPPALPVGLVLVLGGWAAVAVVLTKLARHRATEREHIVLVAAAAWLGAAGVGAHLTFAVGGDFVWTRLGTVLSVWGFLLPVFLAVTHRMLPFFTSSAVRGYQPYRPAWALRVLVGASLAHGVLVFLELTGWSWIPDVPAILAAGRLTWRWWSAAAMRNRMLAVLHVAFGWLTVAFALSAVQSLLQGAAPGFLGQAPLHAMTLGYFASMLLGMASRVTLGHSGQAVVADDAMWRAFWLMQAAAALRIAGDMSGAAAGPFMIWLSSALWLAAFALWAWRYAPAFWRLREDGRPG